MLTPAATPSVSTQGIGNVGGNVQSQHAITVVGGFLFVANPGSKTITQFSISTTDPTVLTFVAQVSTGGDWPNAVGGYSNGGRNLICAAMSGAPNASFACFTFTASGMTPIANGLVALNDSLTTPPASHTGPGQISFTPDGSGIILIDKTPPTVNQPPYLLYSVNAGTNTPSSMPVAVSGVSGAVNFAGAFDASGSFVVADATFGVNILTYSTGSSPSLTLGSWVSVAPGMAPCWIEYSPQLNHFFTGNAASQTLTEVAKANGTLTIINQISVGYSLTDIAIASVGSQDFLYVNGGGSQMIGGFKLGSTTTMIQNISAPTTTHHSTGLAVFVPAAVMSSSSSSSGPMSGMSSMSGMTGSSSGSSSSSSSGRNAGMKTASSLGVSMLALAVAVVMLAIRRL